MLLIPYTPTQERLDKMVQVSSKLTRGHGFKPNPENEAPLKLLREL